MARYLIAIALVAFAIGALYRLSYIYNMGILRMYGSFGILLIGYLGTALIRHVQVGNSRERIFRALKQWEKRGVPLIGFHDSLRSKGYPDYLLITDRFWSIIINDMPNYGGGFSARGLIRLSMKSAHDSAEKIAAELPFAEVKSKGIEPLVLFTRRNISRVPKYENWHNVKIGNIEHLNRWLEENLAEAEMNEKDYTMWHNEAQRLIGHIKKTI